MSERRRVSVTEISSMTQAGAHLPPTTAPVPSAPTSPPTQPAEPVGTPKRKRPENYEVVAMNFKCTSDMARLLARLSEPEGGLRRFLAKTLRDVGHDVPENDLNPPTNRRWAREGG